MPLRDSPSSRVAGKLTRSAPPTTARAPILVVLRGRRQGGTVPDRRRRLRRPGSTSKKSTSSSGTPTFRPSPLASATGSGCRALESRSRAALRLQQVAARPVREVLRRPFRLPARPSTPTTSVRPTRPAGRAPRIDSLGRTMTSVVINPYFQWGSDHAPRTPYHETIIYEAHVKGMTQTHPAVPENLRGTLCRSGAPAVIDHLKSLQRHGDRADAGPSSSWTTSDCSVGPAGTTGATTPSAISHRTPATPPTSRPVERSASSRPWSGPSTRPASR